ncbi:hypothetical protein PFISCL1PPCAC_22620 [Pristionchus fissidentatus]|uniref:Uncharacterized protein n=1 Tax=Pristionchus fissidentatus TaxID=1538716 RepID=A0AAV5WIS2_9BILA|nr:hypothetical protein PFISCL1PPCAC_22620 [Pristionchus fissidentatus]
MVQPRSLTDLEYIEYVADQIQDQPNQALRRMNRELSPNAARPGALIHEVFASEDKDPSQMRDDIAAILASVAEPERTEVQTYFTSPQNV